MINNSIQMIRGCGTVCVLISALCNSARSSEHNIHEYICSQICCTTEIEEVRSNILMDILRNVEYDIDNSEIYLAQMWYKCMLDNYIPAVLVEIYDATREIRHVREKGPVIQVLQNVCSIYSSSYETYVNTIYKGCLWVYPGSMYELLFTKKICVATNQYGLRIISDVLEKLALESAIGCLDDTRAGSAWNVFDEYVSLASGEYSFADLISILAINDYTKSTAICYRHNEKGGLCQHYRELHADKSRMYNEYIYNNIIYANERCGSVTESVVHSIMSCDPWVRRTALLYAWKMRQFIDRPRAFMDYDDLGIHAAAAMNMSMTYNACRMPPFSAEDTINYYPCMYFDRVVYNNDMPDCFRIMCAIECARISTGATDAIDYVAKDVNIPDEAWLSCLSHLSWAGRGDDEIAPYVQVIFSRCGIELPDNWREGLIYTVIE